MSILEPNSTNFRRDLRTSYLASFSKVAAWIAVSVLLAWQSPEAFAIFALARATLTFLNYASSGIVPVLIIDISDYLRAGRSRPGAPDRDTERSVDSATALAILGCMFLGALACGLAFASPWVFSRDSLSAGAMIGVFLCLSAGLIARLFSDVAGAIIQANGLISRDNWILIRSDIVWVAATATGFALNATLIGAASGFLLAGLTVLVLRLVQSKALMGYFLRPRSSDPNIISRQVRRAGMLTLANISDYLYGPSVMILAGILLTATDTAVYASLLQIDSAMLLLVGAVSTVIFPYTARTATDERGNSTLLKYYVFGSLASLAVLATAAMVLLLLRNDLFTLWFKSSPTHRELGAALLPLLLIHTVIGGAGMAGRSVLLGMGRTGIVSTVMLLTGVANVLLVAVFMGLLNWGLRGAIIATIIVVSVRVIVIQPSLILSAIAARRAPAGGN